MLCLVDDAHWLDPATADALVFAARRLGADRVAMVFSVRDGDRTQFRPDGIPEMTLGGLDPAAARALLDERMGDDRAEEVADRLVAETRRQPAGPGGAPEGAQRRTSRGASPLPARLPITARVERSSSTDAADCPLTSGRCCSSSPPTTPASVRSCAGRRHCGLEEQAVAAAVRSGLLVADARRRGAPSARALSGLPGRHR